MNFKNTKTSLVDTLDENSPLIKASKGPQLMLARFSGFSTFLKNRRRNEQVQEEWKRNNPHKVGKPKAREQTLSTEISKDEYLRQERERAETKKKR
tara:strand:- start:2212 stop:2499 length:288 start_codon:yes stop_codon:yes gene_type:complete